MKKKKKTCWCGNVLPPEKDKHCSRRCGVIFADRRRQARNRALDCTVTGCKDRVYRKGRCRAHQAQAALPEAAVA